VALIRNLADHVVEAGNNGVKDGMLPKTVMSFVEKFKPEASYFSTFDGRRTAFFVFEMSDAKMIPSAAEPFFMGLHAEVQFAPAMNLEDMKAGVELAMKH